MIRVPADFVSGEDCLYGLKIPPSLCGLTRQRERERGREGGREWGEELRKGDREGEREKKRALVFLPLPARARIP